MILIIPDIHDKIGQLKKIDTQFGAADPRIYLGDWTDSFKGTVDDQKATVDYLKKELDKSNRTFLWGNHDWHYHAPVHPSGVRGYTSGFSEDRLKLWQKTLPCDWHTKFKFFHYEGKYLLSHAGFNKAPQEWDAKQMPWAVGRARGGSSPYGGPIWLDWNSEFTSFQDDAIVASKAGKGSSDWQRQIVGHTHLKHPQINNNSINLDTGLEYVATLNGSIVSIIKVEG